MLIDQLQRIPEFADLPPFELRALAERAHVLAMPKGRWLVQDRPRPSSHLYLLRGVVETFDPDRRLIFLPSRPILHFYPGCRRARTLSHAQVLRVESSHREFLTEQRLPQATHAAEADQWLRRFLSSYMMSHLSPAVWQQLLRAFHRRTYVKHDKIIAQGTRGDVCYVLESGQALVHQGNHVLCHLRPGDFFGEDALITGGARNADVSALEDVRAHAIEAGVFRRAVLARLVEYVPHPQEGVQLNIGGVSIPSAVPVALSAIRELASGFDPNESYFIVGGSLPQRALCAFLLKQRGLRAAAVGAVPQPAPAIDRGIEVAGQP